MKMTTFFYEQTLKTVTEIMNDIKNKPKSYIEDKKWHKLWKIQENLIDLLNMEQTKDNIKDR